MSAEPHRLRSRRDTGSSDHLLALPPTEIHVWLAWFEEICDASLHEAYRDLLDGRELAQEQRFYFARDRRRYLVTRALVRTLLSRYLPIHPGAWAFGTNAYGRPEIVNPEGCDGGLSFNVSHTHSLIVVGIARRRALGVDVENVKAREVPIDVADRYFAAKEVAALRLVPSHEQQYRFLEYWTFKEAYIKARGMGLSLPLDTFSFDYPHERGVELATHPELADDASRWQFWQFRPQPEYLVAICAERVDAHPPTLIVRRAVPLLSETLFDLDLSRTSTNASTSMPILARGDCG